MNDRELATLLGERMKEIARKVFQEVAHDYIVPPSETDGEAAKLRGQRALIKAKEHVNLSDQARYYKVEKVDVLIPPGAILIAKGEG